MVGVGIFIAKLVIGGYACQRSIVHIPLPPFPSADVGGGGFFALWDVSGGEGVRGMVGWGEGGIPECTEGVGDECGLVGI